ncbi:hypothetical protein GH5_07343 [Leishmania sp. Ghana 2012 LV757]|uniref:hypothetical protein n=1 Tax=Leishmania sp. Ghana 2012 LV757 TaxID=2803181 RepID=UPI001B5A91CF|nr:hypothetical protein GH5_07343 [Leishmania sp. Ghana 2012 LV757]
MSATRSLSLPFGYPGSILNVSLSPHRLSFSFLRSRAVTASRLLHAFQTLRSSTPTPNPPRRHGLSTSCCPQVLCGAQVAPQAEALVERVREPVSEGDQQPHVDVWPHDEDCELVRERRDGAHCDGGRVDCSHAQEAHAGRARGADGGAPCAAARAREARHG